MGLKYNNREIESPGEKSLGISFRTDNKTFGRPRMEKFMLSLHIESYGTLRHEADLRGISVQELIRAVIIPDWAKSQRLKD